MPPWVQQVQAVRQVDLRADDRGLAPEPLACPLGRADGGVLKEVGAVAEPVVVVAADLEALGKDALGARDTRPVIPDRPHPIPQVFNLVPNRNQSNQSRASEPGRRSNINKGREM